MITDLWLQMFGVRSEKGPENNIFWSEIGSGFWEPCRTHPHPKYLSLLSGTASSRKLAYKFLVPSILFLHFVRRPNTLHVFWIGVPHCLSSVSGLYSVSHKFTIQKHVKCHQGLWARAASLPFCGYVLAILGTPVLPEIFLLCVIAMLVQPGIKYRGRLSCAMGEVLGNRGCSCRVGQDSQL